MGMVHGSRSPTLSKKVASLIFCICKVFDRLSQGFWRFVWEEKSLPFGGWLDILPKKKDEKKLGEFLVSLTLQP